MMTCFVAVMTLRLEFWSLSKKSLNEENERNSDILLVEKKIAAFKIFIFLIFLSLGAFNLLGTPNVGESSHLSSDKSENICLPTVSFVYST